MNPFVVSYIMTRKKDNYQNISEEVKKGFEKCSKYVCLFGVIFVIVLIILI